MKEIALSRKELVDVFKYHKCPSCGSYDIIFYNPNLIDNLGIETEFECQECTMYMTITSKLKIISTNRL